MRKDQREGSLAGPHEWPWLDPKTGDMILDEESIEEVEKSSSSEHSSTKSQLGEWITMYFNSKANEVEEKQEDKMIEAEAKKELASLLENGILDKGKDKIDGARERSEEFQPVKYQPIMDTKELNDFLPAGWNYQFQDLCKEMKVLVDMMKRLNKDKTSFEVKKDET